MGSGASDAIITIGAPKVKSIFVFDPMEDAVIRWIREHGAEWVVEISGETRKAISSLIEKAVLEGWSPDELGRAIRPLIGLTERQAQANLRYYQNMKESLLKNNPGMREATAAKRAREAAERYAKRQLRQRAHTIATTELAYAYNRGAYEGIKQAQAQGLIGKVVKVWSTAADEQICEICGGLNGSEVGLDDDFEFSGKVLFAGQNMLPPAHPRCRCAVEYKEVDT